MMGKYGFFSLFAILTLYDITAITVFGKYRAWSLALGNKTSNTLLNPSRSSKFLALSNNQNYIFNA